MRVAIVSTVYKATPPTGYGGIERVVHTLAEALVKLGHAVTLFGVPGSRCSGQTVEVQAYDPHAAPSGIRRGQDIISEEPLCTAMEEWLAAHPVDVIHDWSFQNLFVERYPERVPFLVSTCVPPPPGYTRRNLVACSRAHAALCGGSTRFVHYGLALADWPFEGTKHEPLIHIAKVARYKGQHLTIRAARRAHRRLVIAGNVEDRLYWHLVVRPLLWCSPGVRYAGEIAGTGAHLRVASGLVQAPRWFEAFPLVVLEAAASGTPVVALAAGGIPEQIVDGVNGFLCLTPADLAPAMARIDEIRPRACRAYAEEHFTVGRMAREYVALYERVLDGEQW